jgi:hypothetical protein
MTDADEREEFVTLLLNGAPDDGSHAVQLLIKYLRKHYDIATTHRAVTVATRKYRARKKRK